MKERQQWKVAIIIGTYLCVREMELGAVAGRRWGIKNESRV